MTLRKRALLAAIAQAENELRAAEALRASAAGEVQSAAQRLDTLRLALAAGQPCN